MGSEKGNHPTCCQRHYIHICVYNVFGRNATLSFFLSHSYITSITTNNIYDQITTFYCLLDGQQISLTIVMLYFVVLTKFTWTGKNGYLLHWPNHRCVRFAVFIFHWAVVINIRIHCLIIQTHFSLTGRSFISN